MSTQTPAAIEALFDHYFNHTITPEGMAQLEAWLAEDPAHAQMLARAGMAHGLTREVVKAQMKQLKLRKRPLWVSPAAMLAAGALLVIGLGLLVPVLGTAKKSARLGPRQCEMCAPAAPAACAPASSWRLTAHQIQDFSEARAFTADWKPIDGAVDRDNPPPNSRDQYAHIWDNKFCSPLIQPLSTFSVDVDTAAYANMRRFVSDGQLPPPDAVRIEEMLNYFSYEYAPPAVLQPGEKIGDRAPFAAHTEVCACPWNPAHKLVRIGLKGAEVDMGKRPAAHLTFLIDVSGSMDEADKLPLAKAALIRLLAQLRPDDHLSLVVYAGSSGCVLENATCAENAQILATIDRLGAGGSTAGVQGINQAYEIAQKHFVKGGVNRVILCTDGDFNVGVSDTGSLITLAKEKANPKNGEGVFLSTCGFGRGNLNDHMMEQIADAGNGNCAYIDSLAEAEKVFVKQAGGTLVTIAKDVKLQLEFNPAKVGKYRLIGYENRILKAEDFNDDTVDAGDIGAGHTVTALYEIEPAGANPHFSVDEEIKDLERQAKAIAEFIEKNKLTAETAALQKQAIEALQARIAQLKKPAADRSVDPLTYQSEHKISDKAAASGDLLTLKLRYKQPEAKAEQGTSKLLTFTLKDADTAFEKASADTRFAAAVAAYGMILRGSEFKGTATLGWVEKAAGGTWQQDIAGRRSLINEEQATQRAEFVGLVRKAARLKKD